MPTFTKTLSALNTKELLSAMGAFQLPVPATYTVPSLRSLVKAHLNANPDLMRQPDYSALFTKRVRDIYLAQNPPSPTPPSWHGINFGSDGNSRASSPSLRDDPGSPEDVARPPREPRDLERETRLQLLQALSSEELDDMLDGALNRGEFLFYVVLLTFTFTVSAFSRPY
jgi:hypothetical protein